MTQFSSYLETVHPLVFSLTLSVHALSSPGDTPAAVEHSYISQVSSDIEQQAEQISLLPNVSMGKLKCENVITCSGPQKSDLWKRD